MTGTRLAVIDLGSNTFHLLICALTEAGRWTIVYKERIYVKLGSGGLDFIAASAMERGIEAMSRFREHLVAYQVQHVRCIGTAALREARNGREVADRFAATSGFPVEIIDGQQEASYILRGIQTCIPPFEPPGLIMDIGGGSVEFILYRGDDILFKGSYTIGVAVLFNTFHHTDPITDAALTALDEHLQSVLADLLDAVADVGLYHLVGASGSFEVLNDVLRRIAGDTHWSELDTQNLVPYLEQVIHTNVHARRQIPEIPIERLDYIVVAYALIRFVITRRRPEKLFFCEYALKEGVLEEMIQDIKFRSI